MLYQHTHLGTLVTVLNERTNWVEFYDPDHNGLRYLESPIFHDHYKLISTQTLRALARQQHILVPNELDD